MRLIRHESEEDIEIPLHNDHSEQSSYQELEDEASSLQHQRSRLDDQRALLDLERMELERQLADMELQYAILDAHYARLNRLEEMLAHEYEIVRTTGNRRNR